MKQILEAVYQNGVFRPLNAPKLFDGQEVQLIVYPKQELTPDEMLALAAQVYEGLPMEQINEVEAMALNRSNFFRDDERQ